MDKLRVSQERSLECVSLNDVYRSTADWQLWAASSAQLPVAISGASDYRRFAAFILRTVESGS